jgi:hypothetical protein
MQQHVVRPARPVLLVQLPKSDLILPGLWQADEPQQMKHSTFREPDTPRDLFEPAAQGVFYS